MKTLWNGVEIKSATHHFQLWANKVAKINQSVQVILPEVGSQLFQHGFNGNPGSLQSSIPMVSKAIAGLELGVQQVFSMVLEQVKQPFVFHEGHLGQGIEEIIKDNCPILCCWKLEYFSRLDCSNMLYTSKETPAHVVHGQVVPLYPIKGSVDTVPG